MTVETKLKHAASEARRTVATISPPPIRVAARRARVHRALAAAAVAVVAGLLIGITALLTSRANREPTFVDETPIETPRNAGSAADAGWSTVPGPDYLAGGPNAPIERLANGTWVALDRGWTASPEVPVEDPVEVLWTSADSTTWRSREVAAFDGLAVHASPFNPYGHVLGGLMWAWAAPTDAPEPTSVWITDDAATWHRVEWIDDADSVPSTVLPIELRPRPHLLVAREGRVVFLASNPDPPGGRAARSFVSTDEGRTFAQLDVFPPETTFVLPWSAGDGLSALVSGPDLPPELWRSPDGSAWERIGPPQGLDITLGPDHLFSLGVTVSASPDAVLIGGQSCDGSVFRSTDGGRTWEHLDVAATVPLYEDRGFDYRKGDCHRVASTGEWLAVEGNYRVWATRDGIAWVYFGDSSRLNTYYWMPYVSWVGSGGMSIPPEG
jgi:hypothetical protein